MSYIMRNALLNLCAFARRKPMLFMLLTLSSSAMIYFMLHSINGFVCDINAYKDTRSFDNRVTIDCTGSDVYIEPDDAFRKLKVEAAVRIYISTDERDMCIIALNELPTSVRESPYFMREGNALTDDELTNGAHLCMVTPGTIKRSSDGTYTGQLITLCETAFEITGAHNGYLVNDSGISAWDSNIIVPIEALNSALKVNYISITVHNDLDVTARTAIREWTQLLGIDASINWPKSIIGMPEWQNLALGTLLSAAILLLSLLNSLAALIAWLHVDRAELYALYICGASKRQLISMVGIETGYIALISALPSIALYYATGFIRRLGDIPYNLSLIQIALTVLMCALMLVLLAVIRSRSVLTDIGGTAYGNN